MSNVIKEGLLPLGVIVLQTDLKFDCLCEVSFLLLSGVLEKVLDVLSDIGD